VAIHQCPPTYCKGVTEPQSGSCGNVASHDCSGCVCPTFGLRWRFCIRSTGSCARSLAFWYETGESPARLRWEKVLGTALRDTGPTAWMTPFIPVWWRGFQILASYQMSALSASADALISALIVSPFFFIGRKSFGEANGTRRGLVWAMFPYGISFSGGKNSETWLSTLLTLLFSVGSVHRRFDEPAGWRAGARWGVAALGQPSSSGRAAFRTVDSLRRHQKGYGRSLTSR